MFIHKSRALPHNYDLFGETICTNSFVGNTKGFYPVFHNVDVGSIDIPFLDEIKKLKFYFPI